MKIGRGGGAAASAAADKPNTGGTRESLLRIGLSARILHAESARRLGFRDKTLYYLEASVAHWIMAHGALVFMIPTLKADGGLSRASVTMREYVDALDGLVLQGGADVSPESYGETPRRPEWEGDRIRDLYEIELLLEFVFQEKPVLGICRGAQLINVAFNGTLHQDIGEDVPGAITHVDHEVYDELHHEIEIEPGSRLAQLFGDRHRGRVTSIHHQAVKRRGNGLVVEARSPADGVIEAIRWTGSSFVLGVQWHPEFHPPVGSNLLDSGLIMADFLGEAERRRRTGEGPRPVLGAGAARSP